MNVKVEMWKGSDLCFLFVLVYSVLGVYESKSQLR
jgi:hypothetical protein